MARRRSTARANETPELRAVYADMGTTDAFRVESVKSRVRRFISCYLDAHGFGPYCNEVAEAVGITAKTARQCLYELADDSILTFDARHWRSIRLLGKAKRGNR